MDFFSNDECEFKYKNEDFRKRDCSLELDHTPKFKINDSMIPNMSFKNTKNNENVFGSENKLDPIVIR